MSKFHLLKVAAVKQETNDAISIAFEVPADLQNQFSYTQGQYLTIQASINGEDVRRAYSLCSSPATGELPMVTCKRVDGGKMSNYLNNEVKVGSTLNVMEPQGRFFTSMDATNTKHYILVGGGSGITPLFSILKTVLLKEPNSKISLIYGNRNNDSIIFKNELSELVTKHSDRLNIIHSLDNEHGMLTADKIAQHIQSVHGNISNREYFLCGPQGMMEQAQIAFKNLNLPTANVHIEFFSSPTSTEKKEEVKKEAAMDFEGSKVFVMLGGKEKEIIIKDKTTILHAAIKAGMDAPFSCEAGICSTCMAKVSEGTVKMDENNILSDEEIARGYVLTCQAHPTSKIVRLEYYD